MMSRTRLARPLVRMGMGKKKLSLDGSKREAVLKSLEWMAGNSSFDENGISKTTVSIPYFSARQMLVQHTFNGDVPERTHGRAVSLAIRKWLNTKKYFQAKDKVATFLEALEIETKNLRKRTQKYTTLMFLNVDPKIFGEVQSFTFSGKTIHIRRWDSITHINTSKLWNILFFHSPKNPLLLDNWKDNVKPRYVPDVSTFIPVEVETITYGPEAAVEYASKTLDILRAFLNMSVVFGKFTYFRSHPDHLSVVLPTPIYAVYDKSSIDPHVYFSSEKYDYKQARIEPASLKRVESLMKDFEQEHLPGETYNHISNLIMLYQNSLDTSNSQAAYLFMWQVVESSVTFGDERAQGSDVVSKVASLLKLDPFFKDGLTLIMNTRNRLVHSGEFPASSDNLFFTLKFIAEHCIRSLLALAKDYPTMEDLKDYFMFSPQGDKVLERKVKNAQSILKRQKTQSRKSRGE